MKRLIVSLAVSLSLVLANISTAGAATRYWELRMFDPAASTTSRTINIEYKILSTIDSDTFDVELLENDTPKGLHDDTLSDSGVFTVNIPATGTYTYKVTATNNTDNSTDTESRTVQVVDGPAPTVTTISVNNNAGGQVAGGVQPALANGGADAGGEAAGGQVAGAAANAGQVNTGSDAATDATSGIGDENGDILGASAEESEGATQNRWRTPLLVLLVLGAAGGGYYWFILRPRKSL